MVPSGGPLTWLPAAIYALTSFLGVRGTTHAQIVFHPPIHPFVHPSIHSSIYPPSFSLIHPSVCSSPFRLIHPSIYPPSFSLHPFIHLFIFIQPHPFIRLFISIQPHPSIHSSICSSPFCLIHPFVHLHSASSIHPFIHLHSASSICPLSRSLLSESGAVLNFEEGGMSEMDSCLLSHMVPLFRKTCVSGWWSPEHRV